MVKKWVIAVMVLAGVAVVAGLTVLIVWLVKDPNFETIHLEGGVGDLPQKAAYTRLRRGAHTFWWFYPTTQQERTTRPRPIVLWLDGLLGLPPSLSANFGMFGPYDFDLNRRNDSWINDYNLLFVDAPVGTGFSYFDDKAQVAADPEQYAEDLYYTLQSFYSDQREYSDSPLYIMGQGHGAKQALALVLRMQQARSRSEVEINLKGLVLGGAIISPALVLTKLGCYLEELGYVDGVGRSAIEERTADTLRLVEEGELARALHNFVGLEEFVGQEGGTVAVNMHRIVDKLTREPTRDNYSQWKQLQGRTADLNKFMEETVGPALGVSPRPYDGDHEAAVEGAEDTFMLSDIHKVESILQNTDVNVYFFNGNLDAVSNTPGQLEWIDKLEWSGQSEFLASNRQMLVVDDVLQGHVRQHGRLAFFWINAAGHSTPLDSPRAMRHVLQRIAGY